MLTTWPPSRSELAADDWLGSRLGAGAGAGGGRGGAGPRRGRRAGAAERRRQAAAPVPRAADPIEAHGDSGGGA